MGVAGWKGVLVVVEVCVSVGVEEGVSVKTTGDGLMVGVKMLKVSVAVASGVFVIVAVGVIAFGLGANCTAIQPRQ